jgi:CHAT domain-containing protein
VQKDKSFLFVLTREGRSPSLFTSTLPLGHGALKLLTGKFREKLAARSLDFQPVARQLFDALLAPARHKLEHATSLVIVPDGILWELPFQALMPSKQHFLIEKHAISYAPSLTVLREMLRVRQRNASVDARGELLAFGNPRLDVKTTRRVESVFMDEKLLPLPEAERQEKILSRMYGRDQATVFVGKEAREDKLKSLASSFRILHLATHGILNDSSPMYSHLLLSQDLGAGEDGLLEAWEIANLDLRADLFVLSACETGRGRVSPGEGMVGLTWAVFVAGCPSTLVSQWKVESRSTTELMVAFHRWLRAGRHSKADALRQAAITLLRGRRYAHPFYWAGFILVGKNEQ